MSPTETDTPLIDLKPLVEQMQRAYASIAKAHKLALERMTMTTPDGLKWECADLKAVADRIGRAVVEMRVTLDLPAHAKLCKAVGINLSVPDPTGD